MSEMLRRLRAERDQAQAIIDDIRGDANKDNRDLTKEEIDKVRKRQARIEEIDPQIELEERSIALAAARPPILDMPSGKVAALREVKYERAGEWVTDMWHAGAGSDDARTRLNHYMTRVAAHVTTTDNLGVLPEPILGPLLEYIDLRRPLVAAVGVSRLPGGPSFFRPHITQHTQVGKQAAEKDELPSRKLTIEKLKVDVDTYGGYVNVSRQLIDWSSPDAMDIIVRDLASQYAQETEKALATLIAGGTAGGGSIPADADAAKIAAQIYAAAAKAQAANVGCARLFVAAAPDVVGKLAPAFAPYFPQNAYGIGFSASNAGCAGVMGSISGIPVVMSNQLAAGKAAVVNAAAVEVYEQRIGTLQVTEPSVLGVQVAYAGYFAPVVLAAAGVQIVTVA